MVKLETKISHSNKFVSFCLHPPTMFFCSGCNKCWYISRLILFLFISGVHAHSLAHTRTQQV